MSAPPTRPALRERYDRRQQEVIYQAARAFAHAGYHQTTMQELAASMGLATGALYHYFAAKEELLMAICDQLMEPLLEQATDLLADDGPAPRTQLRALVRMWVNHVVEHRDHMLVFQQQRHVIESGEQWRKVRASRKAFELLVADLLERAAPKRDSRLALLALLGMVNHTAQWYRPRGPLAPRQIADGYTALVLN